MYLKLLDRRTGTRDKYLRDARKFASFLRKKVLNREAAAAWRNELFHNHYAPVTINSMIALINVFSVYWARRLSLAVS